ncbi:MAG TPA: DUF932 domain-containing protein [Candidatus Paceibacterota bacterium]|jgi:hypothetical protein|nr:DUF932 domain-containing protein [Candidatus Paceibacterota bacterium]
MIRNGNRNYTPLTDEQIQVFAPSAFAGQAWRERSERYAFIPTSEVIDAMRNNGFYPIQASQSNSRIEEKHFFTKHMIRFQSQAGDMTKVGDSKLELVLVNSHDGTSAYKLMLGVFRLVCSNGMIVSDGMAESIHVRHMGNIVQDVLTGSFELIKRAPIVESAIAAWRQITLTEAEQQSFAEQALTLRYPEGSPITAEKALRVRRYDDNGSDLWHVFNRVQEAVVRGGDRYYNNGRRNKTREVRGIDQNINLNRSLWSLAEQVAISKM